MRRSLVIALLVALTLPVGAFAAETAPGDGTLSVRNGDGVVALNLRGVVIGFVGNGRLEIERAKDTDCDALNVWGAERERDAVKRDELGRVVRDELGKPVAICLFIGKDIRFRLAAGANELRLVGNKISLSAVGRGVVALKGRGGQQDGSFAVNGQEYRSMPDERRQFVVGAAATLPPQLG
jgi:hypothetical protein